MTPADSLSIHWFPRCGQQAPDISLQASDSIMIYDTSGKHVLFFVCESTHRWSHDVALLSKCAVVSVFAQRGRAASQEPRFNRTQFHRGQPTLFPGLHVTLQPAWVRPEATVRQDSLNGRVRETTEPCTHAPARCSQDGRPQSQPHGRHSRHDPCPEPGRLNRLARRPLMNGPCNTKREGCGTRAKGWDGLLALYYLQMGVYSCFEDLALLWCWGKKSELYWNHNGAH